jgi:hypothetical protein
VIQRRGVDPTAGAKKMLTDAEAMEKGVEDKNKAEADIMEGKKAGLQKQASEQAERDASEEVGRVRRGNMDMYSHYYYYMVVVFTRRRRNALPTCTAYSPSRH